ncbi:SAM-dependent methyltransferase [Saccharopolyspora flava]|uniref:S-adenosyl methyltransferase n=1 Tax=Saccharopolyspora flava TaxID=95161 RepID=A0A1I6RJ13_9PSEU|nr:SAM-dependent methyltransferase [Saccharopolyspora flava]SFS64468.1 S-adenosyl methyltransferase [Saccharopolyspora flava]
MITRTLDLDRPSDARVHDYLLGGGSNFAADRALARRILTAAPSARLDALANRDCLRRMIRTCLDHGVDQFLDLGSGIPTAGSAHEIAPDSPVVYVDNEHLAATQGELLLRGSGTAAMVHADVRDPDAVLGAERTRELLDLDRPVAVLLFGVAHLFGEHHHPAEVIRGYTEALAPGSFLALSHLTDEFTPRRARDLLAVLPDCPPSVTRDRATVLSFLGGLEPLEPGAVPASDWRPDDASEDLRVDEPLSFALLARTPPRPNSPGS